MPQPIVEKWSLVLWAISARRQWGGWWQSSERLVKLHPILTTVGYFHLDQFLRANEFSLFRVHFCFANFSYLNNGVIFFFFCNYCIKQIWAKKSNKMTSYHEKCIFIQKNWNRRSQIKFRAIEMFNRTDLWQLFKYLMVKFSNCISRSTFKSKLASIPALSTGCWPNYLWKQI